MDTVTVKHDAHSPTASRIDPSAWRQLVVLKSHRSRCSSAQDPSVAPRHPENRDPALKAFPNPALPAVSCHCLPLAPSSALSAPGTAGCSVWPSLCTRGPLSWSAQRPYLTGRRSPPRFPGHHLRGRGSICPTSPSQYRSPARGRRESEAMHRAREAWEIAQATPCRKAQRQDTPVWKNQKLHPRGSPRWPFRDAARLS